MREEISNELLLKVIQAWDPSKAHNWRVDKDKDLMWESYFIRENDGYSFGHGTGDSWHEASKLVEFLLKDRPHLNPNGEVQWTTEVLASCVKECGITWSGDPWDKELDIPSPSNIVERIKAYGYLREWKEKQELSSLVLWSDTSCRTASQAELERTIVVDPSDVTLSIEGQTIEGMAGEWKCRRHPDENDSEYRARLENALGSPSEVPATYAPICSYCNGSKEVVGWGGKEKCRAC